LNRHPHHYPSALAQKNTEVSVSLANLVPSTFTINYFAIAFQSFSRQNEIGEYMAKTQTLALADVCKRASELLTLSPETKFPPLAVPALKSLFPKGLNRGGMVELNGSRSSGKTSTALNILAQSTSTGEVCGVVDLNSCFDPHSAAVAGVHLDQLVWIQCRGNIEHAMRSVDLLLHAGGFGIVLLDLSEAPLRALNRIPLSYWYRFQRAIENTPAILLICADSFQAKSCTRHALQIRPKAPYWTGHESCKLLNSLEVIASPHAKITSIRPESLVLTVA
jgi:hypothetical protein